MTKTITSPVTVEEKNHWLGKLAFAALVALKLAQWDGKAARNAQSENLFLLRWLQTALKQKRFHRCVVHDFEWLIHLGQQRLMTSKLKFRLEYLWRSCCCDIASQSDLFRLTYATELLKDLGWDSVVLSDDRWQKLIMKKPVLTSIPTFYVTQSALTAGFSDEGKQIDPVDFWVLGDTEQFSEVIKQHHHCGQFDENLPHYTLLLSPQDVGVKSDNGHLSEEQSVFIILMTTQVIVVCLMLFVYLRSRLHGGSDKYLNTLIFCFILLTLTLIITQSPAPRLWNEM